MMSEQDTVGDRTLSGLIGLYKADPRSTYARVSYRTRTGYEKLCRRIELERGSVIVRQIKNEDLISWHKEWTLKGRTIAHGLMLMLRTVFGFSGTVLEDQDCKRLAVALYEMRLRLPQTQKVWMTPEQAIAVRDAANKRGM